MDNKKNVFISGSKTMSYPRLVINDIHAPSPGRHKELDQKLDNCGKEMEGTIKRIIAHLLENY